MTESAKYVKYESGDEITYKQNAVIVKVHPETGRKGKTITIRINGTGILRRISPDLIVEE